MVAKMLFISSARHIAVKVFLKPVCTFGAYIYIYIVTILGQTSIMHDKTLRLLFINYT